MAKTAPAGRTEFEVEITHDFSAFIVDEQGARAHRTDNRLINRDQIKVNKTAGQFAVGLYRPGLDQSARNVFAEEKHKGRNAAHQLRKIFGGKTLDADHRAGADGMIALHPGEPAGLAENVASAQDDRTSGLGRSRF